MRCAIQRLIGFRDMDRINGLVEHVLGRSGRLLRVTAAARSNCLVTPSADPPWERRSGELAVTICTPSPLGA